MIVRKRPRSLAVALSLAVVLAVGAAPAAAVEPTGSIAGSLTGGGSLDGVVVWRGPSPFGPFELVSRVRLAGDASYTVPSLAPGWYHVQFIEGVDLGPPAGWTTMGGAGHGTVMDVAVAAGETTTVDFTKGTTHGISGSVVEAGGAPVAGAEVCWAYRGPGALAVTDPPCGVSPTGAVTTDGAGAFTIPDLIPGLWEVAAGDPAGVLNVGIEAITSPVEVRKDASTIGVLVRLGIAFTDVPPTHAFHADINWMSWSGIAGGFTDGTYRPSIPVSRQAMAAFLHRFEGEPAVIATTPFFADVAANHPNYTAIQWMAEAGLSTGSPNPAGGKPLYKPTDRVSRQAMAAFLWRTADEPSTSLPGAFFADVPASSPFYAAVQWMADSRLSAGTPNPPGKPLYKPADPVSRQAMAAFLARYAVL